MPPLYYCMEGIKIPHHENYVIAYVIPTYNVDTYINLIKNKKKRNNTNIKLLAEFINAYG
jgi:hypothetical protein